MFQQTCKCWLCFDPVLAGKKRGEAFYRLWDNHALLFHNPWDLLCTCTFTLKVCRGELNEAWLQWMHSLTGAGCINIPCSISFRLCLFPEHSEPLNWNAAEELQGRFFAALLHRLSYTLLPALRQNAQLRQLPQLDREVIIFNHPSLQTTSQGEWCIYIT